MMKIKLLLLGGTIAMTTQIEGGVLPTLSADQLLQQLPQLQHVAEVEPETLMLKPSASLIWEDIRLCQQAVKRALDADFDGVVVLQGTDTLEEVAFILDLLNETEKPIVVSGAMRSASEPGYDGPANLMAAVSVAASKAARGLGCLVVMNDTIHCARFVIKAHTGATNAFLSRLAGPIGMVHEGRPQFLYRPLSALPRFELPDSPAPNVGLFPFAFAQPWPFDMMSTYDAIVLELAGSGHVAGGDVEGFRALAAKLPVIFTSRARNGLTMKHTYGYPGSEIELIEAGLIPAGQYDGAKARLLTMLALWCNKDLRELFKH